MEIGNIFHPKSKEEEESDHPLFVKIESDILKETIVLVFKKEGVKPAMENNPELVLYSPKEVRELKGLSPDQIRLLHFGKKEFNGSICPSE